MRDIFCDKEVIQDFDQLNQKIVLKEEETSQSITISGIPVDSILLKLDVSKPDYKQKSMYLKRGESFIHKGCDYCLIIPSRQIIVLFELKSKKPKERHFIDQFRASEIFIKYCTDLYNYKKCSIISYNFKRILLSPSPKYINRFTDSKRIMDISSRDSCGNTIEIKTPGFPPTGIRLEKLIR